MYKALKYIIILLFISNLSYAQKINNDFIIIIDTSGSMKQWVKKVKMPLIDFVKREFLCFLNELEVGDKVALFTFDERAKEQLTIEIKNRDDRKKIIETILSLEANGLNTNMADMQDKALNKAEIMEKENPDRQILIYLLSDGVNDPPKWETRTTNDILNVFKRYEGKSWIFQYLPIGSTKESTKVDLTLQKGIEDTFQGSSIPIEADQAALAKSILEVKKKSDDLKKKQQSKVPITRKPEPTILDKTALHFSKFWWIYLAVILVGLCIYFLLIYLKLREKENKAVVRGFLELVNKESRYTKKQKVDLKACWKKEVVIGKSIDCDVVIEDLNCDETITIQAYYNKHKKRQMYHLLFDHHLVHFSKRRFPEHLSFGDVFQFDNYEIKFSY